MCLWVKAWRPDTDMANSVPPAHGREESAFPNNAVPLANRPVSAVQLKRAI